MEQLELVVTVVALVALATLATLAVFSPAYSDTTVQRIALAGIAIGALGVAWWCWQANDAPGPVVVLSVSASLFGAETGRKIWSKRRRGRWTAQH
jgi:hypothetical protein